MGPTERGGAVATSVLIKMFGENPMGGFVANCRCNAMFHAPPPLRCRAITWWAAMALIEGVGDEVTLLLAALTTVAVLLLAWASTRTSDPQQPRPLDATSPLTTSLPDPPASSAQALDEHKDGGAGEGPAAGGDGDSQRNMVLRLKFLNDTERMAHVKPQDTVGYIKR